MYAVTTTTTTDANGVPIGERRTHRDRRFGGQFRGTGTGLGSTSPSQGSQNGISSMFPRNVRRLPGMGSPTGSPTGMSGNRDVGDDVRRRRPMLGFYAAGGQGVRWSISKRKRASRYKSGELQVRTRPGRSGAARWLGCRAGRQPGRIRRAPRQARTDAGDADDESKSGDSFSTTDPPPRSAAMKKPARLGPC